MTAAAGEAAHATVVHERYGSVSLAVRMQSLNESGVAVYAPVAGAQISVQRAEESGALTDTGVVLTTDENGLAVTPLMEAGEATVRTVTAPQEHDAAVGQTVFVEAGKAAYAAMSTDCSSLFSGRISIQKMGMH